MKKNNSKKNRKNQFYIATAKHDEYFEDFKSLADIFDITEIKNDCEGMIPYDDLEMVKSFMWRFLLMKAFNCKKVDRKCYTHQITGPEMCPTMNRGIPSDHILLADLDRGNYMHSLLVEAGLIEDWMILSFPINLSQKGTTHHPFRLILGEENGQKYFMIDGPRIDKCSHIKVEFTDESELEKIKRNYYQMLN